MIWIRFEQDFVRSFAHWAGFFAALLCAIALVLIVLRLWIGATNALDGLRAAKRAAAERAAAAMDAAKRKRIDEINARLHTGKPPKAPTDEDWRAAATAFQEIARKAREVTGPSGS